jgi:eukaryotic-like serine/threonine-protein kinase
VNSGNVFHIKLFGSPSIAAETGRLVTGPAAQRHRVALLALLALAPDGRATRDRLLAYLWPESSSERARQLLNQAVYQLRKALGEDALVSTGDELRLNAELLRVDVALFEQALASGANARAVELYRGPLLDGFFLSETDEFERWVERERARLAHACAHALETLAEAAESVGDFPGAVEWWNARAAHDPYDSRIARRLVQALATAGNCAGALRYADQHAHLLRDDLEIAPPPELEALAQQIRGSNRVTALRFSSAGTAATRARHDDVAPPPASIPDDVAHSAPRPRDAARVGAAAVAARPWRWYAVTAAVAAVAGAAAVGVVVYADDERWLLETALPGIEKYLDVADWESAYQHARAAEARVPDSPVLADLWSRISWRVSIRSEPAGARVYRQAWAATDDRWEELGETPLVNIRIPHGLSRIRLELPGHRTVIRSLGGAHVNWDELRPINPDFLLVGPETYRLDAPDALPADMVRVPGGTVMIAGDGVQLDDFFISRHEVTNAEFRRFVDAGGYGRQALWDPIVIRGDTIPWEQAVTLWVDRTGRPGPSTWEAGDYPHGETDHPVSGVSWYEAAAYARFVGRELPTAHHWQQALANALFPWLLPASNFSGERSRAVTAGRAMSHVEAFDLTGNVREWTATRIGEEYVVLGGSWDDPHYIAGVVDTSAPPIDRSPGNGIRLATTRDDAGAAARLRAPLHARSTAAGTIDYEPASDEIFAAYSRVFDYDRRPLNAALQAVDTTRLWVRERVAFDAAYGDERMIVHLYLPTGGREPFQTVVYWPGWDTFGLDDVDQYFARQLDFIVKSGRAVAFPIYLGSFERRVGSIRARPEFGTAEYRDNTIYTVKDLRRTIDYLETRTDIRRDALAFFGYSWGGINGPIALAHEPRLRVSVIKIGMLPPIAATPEVDPVHALPRVTVPTLMFSGEFDPMVPSDNSNRYFALIGAADARKRHVKAIGGHFIPRPLVIRETLDWLDRHLGPVDGRHGRERAGAVDIR